MVPDSRLPEAPAGVVEVDARGGVVAAVPLLFAKAEADGGVEAGDDEIELLVRCVGRQGQHARAVIAVEVGLRQRRGLVPELDGAAFGQIADVHPGLRAAGGGRNHQAATESSAVIVGELAVLGQVEGAGRPVEVFEVERVAVGLEFRGDKVLRQRAVGQVGDKFGAAEENIGILADVEVHAGDVSVIADLGGEFELGPTRGGLNVG